MLCVYKGWKQQETNRFVEESNAESNKQNEINISSRDKYFTSSVRSKDSTEISAF